jgi:hypothetical protein
MWLAPTPRYGATLMGAPDGAARNFHTLQLMRQMINRAKVDPEILRAAHSIIWLTPEKNEHREVQALFRYVRDYIRYVKDPHGVEALCYPAMTLQRRLGDCDDQTMLLCALCEACGYPTRLVMGQFFTDDWEHVWCQVAVNGQWLDCDPIEKSGEVGDMPLDPVRLFIERV